MRVLIHSVPPWAHSGYGVQCAIASQALRSLGHNVAISAYAGVHEEREWHGVPVLGTGGKPYGNGVIAGNYHRWNSDLLILFCDPWTIDPGQLGGLRVMPWMPVDCEPLGVMDSQWLTRAAQTAAGLFPVAMSQHGQRMLAAEGWQAPVVPHAARPHMTPDTSSGLAWREQMGISPGAFLISKIGVNNEDDRKAFEVTLQAYAQFSRKYADAVLYLHTEPQAKAAPNLAAMALELGLKGRVVFADEDRRACDLYPASWMAGLHQAADVLDAATKAEGFGVPVIESLACGTPVIGCRNSAVTEKIRPEWGWLVSGQRTWPRHHQRWWVTPSVTDLARAYERAYTGAASMRKAAAAAGDRWSAAAMRQAWATALEPDHVRVFGRISEQGGWGGMGSGSGSDPEVAAPYCRLVERYIREHRIRSVLDLGCGDGRIAAAIDWGPAEYRGLDVAITGQDIRTCDLGQADLVLVKDVLQHWPVADVQAMLPRLQRFPHVLITNSAAGIRTNADIPAGDFRSLDLAAPPFSWPVTEVLRWTGDEPKSVVELAGLGDPP